MPREFQEIWAVDFEFIASNGNVPDPVCLVAKELISGKTIRLWRDQFGPVPPYPVHEDSLFVAYFASAELGCHLALNWPIPKRVCDLFTEYRAQTNGLNLGGNTLLAALATFGLDTIGAIEKKEMRDLILRGPPWSNQERQDILDYCESDVDALSRLFPKMLAHGIDMSRALVRGRYMAAVARMEHAGVPINKPLFERIKLAWPYIQSELIKKVDAQYGVFEDGSFKLEKFAQWLIDHNIPWPRLGNSRKHKKNAVKDPNRLDLSEDAFRDMAKCHPELNPLRELRSALSELRLNSLTVGVDSRNRTLLSPFQARTSRNPPSNAKSIFGPAVWLRNLIEPAPGWGISYIDYCQQEFGIAAALSNDPRMIQAYISGDPYLLFAIQAGAIPRTAADLPKEIAKQRYGDIRELYKICALAMQYGMEAEGLALRIASITPNALVVANQLMRAHKEQYRVFWRWSDSAVDHAMLLNEIHTIMGWTLYTPVDVNPRSIRNFPMQANGAEMLRLACCEGTEAGIQICAPVHDAVLIAAPLDRIDADVANMRAIMGNASKFLLRGFEIGTHEKTIRYPDHYTDKRGTEMWQKVIQVVDQFESDLAASQQGVA
jgi:hypothetical protein